MVNFAHRTQSGVMPTVPAERLVAILHMGRPKGCEALCLLYGQ